MLEALTALIADVKNPERRECPSAGKWVNIPWSPLRAEMRSSLVENSGSQATCSHPTNAGSSPTYGLAQMPMLGGASPLSGRKRKVYGSQQTTGQASQVNRKIA